MLGYSADEMIGISTSAPLHLVSEMAERGRELSESYGSLIEGFRVLVHVPEIIGHETQQWTYVRKDGSKLTVQLTVTTIRNEDGEIVGYLGVALDITERLRQEAALRHASSGGGRKCCQERVPGEHESRNTHTDECGDRCDIPV